MSENGLERLLTVQEAIALLDSMPIEATQLRRCEATACRRPLSRLAEQVVSDRDYPPFDKAVMDGYAVRFDDVASVPAELELAGEVAAGQGGSVRVEPRTCVAIMTGAPLPEGADTVIPIEETQSQGRRVRILKAPRRRAAIATKGSDLHAGDQVLPAGTVIGPAQVGALAQVGAFSKVPQDLMACVSPLRSHLLVTGNEIVDPAAGFEPGAMQIRDANGPMIRALLASMDVSVSTSHELDDFERIRTAIDAACTNDIVFVTGGMSMGKYDFVPRALLELGFDLKITKLRIKPGKPFVFATRTRSEKTDYLFGLPGNPVSAFCCTLRLASRLVVRLQGRTPPAALASALLEASLAANGPREFYQPAVVTGASVLPLAWKGSADVFTLARSNALIVRKADDPAREIGAAVDVLPFPL